MIRPAASRRFQLGAIFAAYAAAGIYWGTYIAALPALQATSGLSDARFGLLLTTTTIGGIIAMQGLGRVLHRVQAVAIPFSMFAFAIGMGLIGQALGPVSLGLALFWAGAASGALDISLNMRVARIEADFGLRLFNRVHALFPFSMLLNSAFVGWLRQEGATPALIFPLAALPLVLAGLVEWRAGAHQLPGADKGKGPGHVRLRGVLIVLGALAALGAVMEGGASVWSAIYVETELGSGPAMAGVCAAAITLGLTVGRLIAHQLEHRFRDMVIIRASALLALPAFVILSSANTPLLALVGFFIAGVGVGPVEPAVFRSVSKRHAEADRGRALALVTGLAYVGFLVSPPMMGAVIDYRGWAVMWLVMCLFCLAASALTLRVPPSQT
jgi:Major Facilitator Superfamily